MLKFGRKGDGRGIGKKSKNVAYVGAFFFGGGTEF